MGDFLDERFHERDAYVSISRAQLEALTVAAKILRKARYHPEFWREIPPILAALRTTGIDLD